MAPATDDVRRQAEEATGAAGYAPGEQRPLAAYAGLTTAFGLAVGGALAAAGAAGRELPERLAPSDVVLAGLATQKLSRLISKDKVTSFLRAPFVRFEESAGHGELSEEPRGHGLRYAIGELLACPYCISQWVAAGFGVGLV